MDYKIEILHLTHDMCIGGTEQVIRQIVCGLENDKLHCSVLCIDNRIGPIGTQIQEEGFNVDTLDRKPGFDVRLIIKLRQYIHTHRIEILHCHQYTPFVYGALATLFTRTKVIYTEHGRFHPDRYSWKRRLINPLLGYTTNTITAISEATKKALVEYEWFSQPSIRVIYNGLIEKNITSGNFSSKREFGMPDDALVFGTIARLDEIKNQKLMLEAFSKLNCQQNNTYLLIVGDGPEREYLERYTNSLGISRHVHFAGFQTDINPYLAIIDIFLLSSLSEGTSMTLLEAMSCRKPCVVTDVGGNVEILEHRVSGMVTASGNVEQFSKAMLELASNSNLRTDIGNFAYTVFKDKFDLQHMISGYTDIYFSLAKNQEISQLRKMHTNSKNQNH